MALQNRVDPFGSIHADEGRGLFTGNRGIIHDPETRTLLRRRWTTSAWIICALEHPRGYRREPMGRNGRNGGAGWTELFFLDEVTALAAGHRPCFYCRREAANAFLEASRAAVGTAGLPAKALDDRLHKERRVPGGVPAGIDRDEIARLPDGAMVSVGSQALAIRRGRLLPWSFAGYDGAHAAEEFGVGPFSLLTPTTTLAALRAGYRPVWHETAEA